MPKVQWSEVETYADASRLFTSESEKIQETFLLCTARDDGSETHACMHACMWGDLASTIMFDGMCTYTYVQLTS